MEAVAGRSHDSSVVVPVLLKIGQQSSESHPRTRHVEAKANSRGNQTFLPEQLSRPPIYASCATGLRQCMRYACTMATRY